MDFPFSHSFARRTARYQANQGGMAAFAKGAA